MATLFFRSFSEITKKLFKDYVFLVLVAPHIKKKKSKICRKMLELWSVTYIHTNKDIGFFSAYAIISYALRARNKKKYFTLFELISFLNILSRSSNNKK